MLASVTNTLYKKLESCKIAKVILYMLDDMFGGHSTLDRQSTINSLIKSQQKPDTSIKDRMITLIGYFAEAMDNDVNLDKNTQIEMVFKTLSKDFAGFRAPYNIGNKNLTYEGVIIL
ncbi:hypothetical protein PVK06_003146 [Gossypium arboreum]|uniref:Uncharacterized protein n=1 Tax=Gossypium arboreum TaxID=29729 RepID=A0ABR0R6T1_GOSAR|nr:hypothetical protein PVK06_003146 [Gossypium arboreum]